MQIVAENIKPLRRVDEIMTTIKSIHLRLDGVKQHTQKESDYGRIRNTSITNPID